MCSMVSFTPEVDMMVYRMTKCFINYFSVMLHEESQGRHDIMSVNPACVATSMTIGANPWDKIDTNTCVSGALRDLGKYNECVPNWLQEAIFIGVFNTLWYVNHQLHNYLLEIYMRLSKKLVR
eukprot:CAMPEP_0168318724 /NCGR_PEP_ID=MMETSP0213-20121227/643_1 /TAXON_ID=151035 /ORGANISM="Euplotes harpa, Strain FSP1.4" /LENGTH=122 /DNA_ID=CAMNT_0008319833 /DNA_START=513 /DNA_END=881 /DNA_ORIENTATION=+